MTGNLEHWEDLARFHGTGDDGFYDVDALVRGDRDLGSLERAGLDEATRGAGVSGLTVAHLQSHIGFDTISLARLGADVTAIDFSPTALERLAHLAERCGVSVQRLVADSRALAGEEFAHLHARFDVVYSTIGVISWIDDLGAWMRGVSALLRPGGRLVLVELHPLLAMVESVEPLVVDFPYVHDGVRHFEGTGSYANPDAGLPWAIDQYAWSLGETVNAALGAGLVVVRLDEHCDAEFDPRGSVLTAEEDGMFRLRLGSGAAGRPAEPLPLLFTLVAERPAGS